MKKRKFAISLPLLRLDCRCCRCFADGDLDFVFLLLISTKWRSKRGVVHRKVSLGRLAKPHSPTPICLWAIDTSDPPPSILFKSDNHHSELGNSIFSLLFWFLNLLGILHMSDCWGLTLISDRISILNSRILGLLHDQLNNSSFSLLVFNFQICLVGYCANNKG